MYEGREALWTAARKIEIAFVLRRVLVTEQSRLVPL